ncbi:MAG: peptide chain release factor 1, partial [Armatimonadetes bacterium]|nr:peptide chain release factor 1 [Armatimonadota bacterium]
MLNKLKILEEKYEALNLKLCDINAFNDPKEYAKIAKERASLEEIVLKTKKYRSILKEIEDAKNLVNDDLELKSYLEEELEKMFGEKKRLEEELTLLLIPEDPYLKKNIIMEIRAGTGGHEAALFAGELSRMYLRYAEKKNWKAEILNSNPTELGGYKEIILGIKGENVYSYLKFESGVHRVQRVPITESSGRVHTSTATVAVLPEAEEFEVEINPQDLRIDTYRASGAGGQHVNKTDSAVRITYLPTNLAVACQDERSQHQNKEKAMRILRAKLLEEKKIKQEKEIALSRRSQVGTGERSEKIRTYNFPQSRLTDHRIGVTLHNL